MTLPLVVLAFLSLVGGFALHYNETLQHWLYPAGLSFLSPESVHGHPAGWVGQALMALSIGAAAIGIVYGILIYGRGLPKKEGLDESQWSPVRLSARDQFGYDRAVVEASIEGGGQIGNFLWKGFDAGFIDGVVNGLAFLAGQFGRVFRVFQTGYARTYALLMLVGGVALLGWLMLASKKAPEAPISPPAEVSSAMPTDPVPLGGER